MKMANAKLLVCALGLLFAAELASAKPLLREAFLQVDPEGRTAQAKPEIHVEEQEPEAPLAPFGDPEGGIAPLIPQHTAEWTEESKLPKSVQWLLACAWILSLASIPFIIPLIDHKPITKTQIVVGGTMLAVLLGGFYLFTNVVLFQSPHFKRTRPLTMVECIYFMTQVITTVGYGDITPAKTRGQIFVGFYVLGALFVIAMLVSDLTTHMIAMANEYKGNLYRQSQEENEAHQGKTIKCLIMPQKPSVKPLLGAMLLFAVIDLIWLLFFSIHPGEAKTVFQAAYMSLITLSSVGFGYFTPVTEEGMIFASFFMILGCATLVNVITHFTELMVKFKEWEHFALHPTTIDTLQGVAQGEKEMSEAKFLQFALLQMKSVTQHELDIIDEAFAHLNPKDGLVDVRDIEDMVSQSDCGAMRPASPERPASSRLLSGRDLVMNPVMQ